jgi:hypothetical protein
VADLDGTGIVEGERLLAQRPVGWKLACSLWVVVVGIGFVMFSVLGWALGAVLSRSRKMWVWTLVWAVLYGFAGFAMERMNEGSDVGVTIFIGIWVASIAHAAYLSRGVLRARAVALARDRDWRAAAVTPPAQQPPQPDLPTIPLPEGVSRQRGDLRD